MKRLPPRCFDVFLAALRSGDGTTKACERAGISLAVIKLRKRRDAAFADEIKAIQSDRVLRGGKNHGVPPVVWDQYFETLSRLGSLSAASAQPGMPCSHTVVRYRAIDASIRARFDAHVQARRLELDAKAAMRRERNKPSGTRSASLITAWAARNAHVDWEGALSCLREGESLTSLRGRGNFPNKKTWNRRRSKDPDFARRADEAAAKGGVSGYRAPQPGITPDRLGALLAVLKSGVHIKDAVKLPHMPAISTVYKLRRQDAGFRTMFLAAHQPIRWTAAPDYYGPSDFEKVIELVRTGRTLKGLRGQDGPVAKTVRKYAAANPEFDRRLRLALQERRYADEGGYSLRHQLSQNALWAAANAAVSTGLATFIRDDVISEMVADVLEGYLAPRDIKAAAREYVSAYYSASGAFSARSFDAPLYTGSGASLHDRVSAR